jgi:predicted nucleotidyltransferase
MASKKADEKYKKLVREFKKDPNVLAFWLSGSRGKGMITKASDYDCIIIVKDVAKEEYEKKYVKDFKDPEFDMFVRKVDELKKHALYGTDLAWDRFNYAYINILFDKTEKIQKIINAKTVVSKKEAGKIIKDENGLDGFINQVYRAAKCKRDSNLIAAQLEAAEAIPCLLDCIFALEGRIKPYHKYLAWDMDCHPLKKLPWKADEFIKKLLKILKDGDEKTLLELFTKTRPIFIEAGYGAIYDSWKGKYKVG